MQAELAADALLVAVAEGARYRLLLNRSTQRVVAGRGVISRVTWHWLVDDCLAARVRF
jgi:hypothetical protein